MNGDRPAIANCRHETIQANAFDWLRETRYNRFDLIVLDPPSLARREADRAEAVGAYGRLLDGALALLRGNGILIAASCSAHVTAAEFFGLAREAARRGDRGAAVVMMAMSVITRRFWPRRVFGRERDDRPLDAADFADGPLRREADGLPFLGPRRIAGDRDEGLRPRDIDSADRVRRHERYAAGTGNLLQSLQDIRFIRHGRCSSPIAFGCVLRRMGAKIHGTIDAIAKPVALRKSLVASN